MRATQSKDKVVQSLAKAAEAQQTCKRTEMLTGRIGSQFTKDLEENENNLQGLNAYLNEVEAQIPNLNQQVGPTFVTFVDLSTIRQLFPALFTL